MVQRIQHLQPHFPLPIPKKVAQNKPVNFHDVLKETQGVKVSKHASERINERNIEINDKQWEKISEKMNEAREKGVTDSLVLMDNAALLVSTKNHTIITAMNKEEASTKIFTNINGTILINE